MFEVSAYPLSKMLWEILRETSLPAVINSPNTSIPFRFSLKPTLPDSTNHAPWQRIRLFKRGGIASLLN